MARQTLKLLGRPAARELLRNSSLQRAKSNREALLLRLRQLVSDEALEALGEDEMWRLEQELLAELEEAEDLAEEEELGTGSNVF